MPDDAPAVNNGQDISSRSPQLRWGPKNLRAWAGQFADLQDARQPLPDGTTTKIVEAAQGRVIVAEPPGGNNQRRYLACGTDGPEFIWATPAGAPEEEAP